MALIAAKVQDSKFGSTGAAPAQMLGGAARASGHDNSQPSSVHGPLHRVMDLSRNTVWFHSPNMKPLKVFKAAGS
jgi:hypothetical protein